MSSITFQAIGTHWQIDLPSEVDLLEMEKIIRGRLEIFESTYSRFRPSSWLSQTSLKPGEVMLPADAKPMMDLFQILYRLTDGAFTPLIGSVLSQAGYDANYSFTESKMEQPPSWSDALDYQFPRLRVRQPVGLDFGGVGKGYAIDLVGNLLKDRGIQKFSIDAGGDILHADPSEKLFRVGLEDPEDATHIVGIAQIENESICGSSGNRRQWGRFHHLIDPHKLESPTRVKASWVIANSATIADALATCLFFVEPEKLLTEFHFEYVVMHTDRSARISKKFPGELYT